jgi:hypothetical protein
MFDCGTVYVQFFAKLKYNLTPFFLFVSFCFLVHLHYSISTMF